LEFEHIKEALIIQKTIYKSLISEYEMLKLSQEGEVATFQILELAELPDIKSGPSRGKLCIIVTMAVFFLSIFLAFILEFITNIKNNSESMEKLRATVKKK
ncbi:MAG: lipopolysaccharide biosynthesis protein, partial [Bacteroidota bacterium]|nr:lipopolysaccharide biosynthesis protein [Bacteroidota bacterium]